ncbi:unnamed protein product [Clonostachys solani]|uniref:Uncharacterized protein n=1 Tax=Clonostachys solani TaxID=160281 RepID=A0A9N9ZKF3_9HYPO|nr:unnamed protein product [Clonostachys solani]
MDQMPPPSSQMPPPSSQMPPPSSQSHFEKFDNFVPDSSASFEDEFARLASSQDWASGTSEFQKQRTIALRSELKLHYFSSQNIEEGQEDLEDVPLTEEAKLAGFQALCEEVGIPTHGTIEECQKHLKKTLVNIVDLIDTRRTGKKVKVWTDFEKFRKYTLKRPINLEEAKEDGGILASLLQHLRFPRGEHRRPRIHRGNSSRVTSGRVMKKETQKSSKTGAIHLLVKDGK